MALNLVGTVSLDGSGFEAGLKRIEHGAAHAGEVLKGLALSAIGIYGIEQAIHKTIETADKLVDTSRRLGVGLDALQKLGYAAEQNGASIEDLTTFIEKLNSTRIDPKHFESFAKLGINQKDLSTLKVEDLISKLSVNLHSRSSQDIIGPLRDIGGRGAGALLVMLKDDLNALAEEAEKLGIIIKSEDLLALKFISDEMKILAMVMTGMLAPAIVYLFNQIIKAMNTIKADGTFWGTFSANKGGQAVAAIWDELTSSKLLNKRSPEEMKKLFEDLNKGFVEAGAVSETVLNELDDASAEMIKKLSDMQKQIEDINRHPQLDIGIEKNKHPHHQIQGDALTRVGNFLGSSAHPMVRIGEKQLHILHQIERNTSHGGHNGSQFALHRGFPHQ